MKHLILVVMTLILTACAVDGVSGSRLSGVQGGYGRANDGAPQDSGKEAK